MHSLFKIAALAALAGLSSAGNINVVNKCAYTVQVGSLTNGQPTATNTAVNAGASQNFPLADNWAGRFWGRKNCVGPCTNPPGGADPASLAEFTFQGAGGLDFYDVSFVDGYNLPIQISPINGETSGTGKYDCGSPTCATLPSCPSELQVNGGPVDGGCLSACSKWGTEEYCCTGAHNTPDTCPPSSYSEQVKNACPDVYSYAYDDQASTYTCKATGYTITFCP